MRFIFQRKKKKSHTLYLPHCVPVALPGHLGPYLSTKRVHFPGLYPKQMGLEVLQKALDRKGHGPGLRRLWFCCPLGFAAARPIPPVVAQRVPAVGTGLPAPGDKTVPKAGPRWARSRGLKLKLRRGARGERSIFREPPVRGSKDERCCFPPPRPLSLSLVPSPPQDLLVTWPAPPGRLPGGLLLCSSPFRGEQTWPLGDPLTPSCTRGTEIPACWAPVEQFLCRRAVPGSLAAAPTVGDGWDAALATPAVLAQVHRPCRL